MTMSELENETGLTKGAFYHYFRSKEEIYIEVINKFYFANHSPFNESVELEGTLQECIQLHLNHLDRIAKKFKEITNIDRPDPTSISLIMEAKEYYPGFIEKLKVQGDTIFNNWVRVITYAEQKGEIRAEIDADILAENFIAINYSIFRYILNGRSIEFSFSCIS